jgi:hypothetical protein
VQVRKGPGMSTGWMPKYDIQQPPLRVAQTACRLAVHVHTPRHACWAVRRAAHSLEPSPLCGGPDKMPGPDSIELNEVYDGHGLATKLPTAGMSLLRWCASLTCQTLPAWVTDRHSRGGSSLIRPGRGDKLGASPGSSCIQTSRRDRQGNRPLQCYYYCAILYGSGQGQADPQH